MTGIIRQLCYFSIFAGAILTLTPEGQVKKILQLLCTASLLLTVAGQIRTLDLESFAMEKAKIREQEERFLESSSAVQERMNRLVIQNAYETYIWDKAEQLGMDVQSVRVKVKWSTEGYWYPYELHVTGQGKESVVLTLSDLVRTELGIPEARQEWSRNEQAEG